MDTDDLSQEAYEAIISEAERFNHNLTLQFGLLSYECQDEQEYILKSILLIKALKKAKPNALTNIFFGEVPNLNKFIETLDKILDNIGHVNQIPIDSRHYDVY